MSLGSKSQKESTGRGRWQDEGGAGGRGGDGPWVQAMVLILCKEEVGKGLHSQSGTERWRWKGAQFP